MKTQRTGHTSQVRVARFSLLPSLALVHLPYYYMKINRGLCFSLPRALPYYSFNSFNSPGEIRLRVLGGSWVQLQASRERLARNARQCPAADSLPGVHASPQPVGGGSTCALDGLFSPDEVWALHLKEACSLRWRSPRPASHSALGWCVRRAFLPASDF